MNTIYLEGKLGFYLSDAFDDVSHAMLIWKHRLYDVSEDNGKIVTSSQTNTSQVVFSEFKMFEVRFVCFKDVLDTCCLQYVLTT